jgi:three-Cys-motif partner protein
MPRKTSVVAWQEGDPLPPGFILAKDGIPARSQGPWAQGKLRFLQEYLPPALVATKRKGTQTHYVDLFAGPGRNAGEGSAAADFPGSPIVALRAARSFPDETIPRGFGHFHFCNKNLLEDQLLRLRVERELPQLAPRVRPDQVRFYCGDANDSIHEILDSAPEWAYLIVFADIEGHQDLRFETLRALKRRHKSVDLYVLYPTGLGLDRALLYDPVKRSKYRARLDAYFGSDAWWAIVESRKSDAQSAEMRQQLLQLYRSQLQTIWPNVEVVVQVEKRGRRLYHMLFAHDHEAAASIAKSAKRRSGQYGLLDELG